uniref:Uncharacterized protein n=1 Tax=Anguilla anguilla TaxID=7936 RepID=A0A0E9XK42_ANGAN
MMDFDILCNLLCIYI